ncbi:MAG: aminodeoxychorismate lyase [Acidiferrobacter sp.]
MSFLRCFVNGRPETQMDVTSRGLQYGDGLFETIPVQNSRLLLWPQHLRRLALGALRLGLAPINEALLTTEARELAQGTQLAILKLLLVRETSGRGYRALSHETDRILTLWPWPERHTSEDGMDLMWCQTRLARQPRLAGLKHLNRLEQVLAQQELGSRYREGLMQDTDGWVVEGTMTNVFLGRRGVLVTPRLDYSGVAGIMRAQVIAVAQDLGIEVRIDHVTREQVLTADELFLTNSVLGICAARTLPERHYEYGPIAQKIQETLGTSGDIASP